MTKTLYALSCDVLYYSYIDCCNICSYERSITVLHALQYKLCEQYIHALGLNSYMIYPNTLCILTLNTFECISVSRTHVLTVQYKSANKVFAFFYQNIYIYIQTRNGYELVFVIKIEGFCESNLFPKFKIAKSSKRQQLSNK